MSERTQSKGKSPTQQEDVYQIIVNELDQGRDVLQLYKQLSKALPIHCFHDLEKAFGKDGLVHFRDEQVGLEVFKGMIPEFIFPIMDAHGLIMRLAQLVQVFPADIGYDIKKEETNMMMSKRRFTQALFPSNQNNPNALGAINSGTSTVTDINALKERLRNVE